MKNRHHLTATLSLTVLAALAGTAGTDTPWRPADSSGSR